MKKLLILIIICATAFGASAQVKYGVKAGLNLSMITSCVNEWGLNETATSLLPGVFVSGHINLSLSNYFGIQPEVSFSMQGGQRFHMDVISAYDIKVRMLLRRNYINIPLLLEVKPFDNFSIFVGPQIGFTIYESASLGINREPVIYPHILIEEREVNSTDYAVVVGIQYTIKERFLISARYNIGLSTTEKKRQDSGPQEIEGKYNRVFQLGVGYQF